MRNEFTAIVEQDGSGYIAANPRGKKIGQRLSISDLPGQLAY